MLHVDGFIFLWLLPPFFFLSVGRDSTDILLSLFEEHQMLHH